MNNVKNLNADQLRAAIEQATKDVAVYERLKAAKNRLAELQIEEQARIEAATEEVRQQRERNIAQWEVRSIEFTHPMADESITASRTLTLFNNVDRREVRIPLDQADAFQKAALLRVPEKLPVSILALADTPTGALERWATARRRGYLAEDRSYARTL